MANKTKTPPPPLPVDPDFVDGIDEELEMELDDARLDQLLKPSGRPAAPAPGGFDRRRYLRELFRLQGELIRLRD
jgi:hypothetical protein